MTKQEAFDLAVRGIIKQGGPSAKLVERAGFGGKRTTVHCLYRAENGRRCAAGHCIPDDKYSPEMENKTLECYRFNDVGWGTAGLATDQVSTSFMSALQRRHDNATYREKADGSPGHEITPDDEFIVAFRASAREFAAQHNLDAAACEEGL